MTALQVILHPACTVPAARRVPDRAAVRPAARPARPHPQHGVVQHHSNRLVLALQYQHCGIPDPASCLTAATDAPRYAGYPGQPAGSLDRYSVGDTVTACVRQRWPGGLWGPWQLLTGTVAKTFRLNNSGYFGVSGHAVPPAPPCRRRASRAGNSRASRTSPGRSLSAGGEALGRSSPARPACTRLYGFYTRSGGGSGNNKTPSAASQPIDDNSMVKGLI